MAEVNSAVLPQNVAMQGSGSLASALRLALLFAAAKLVFQFALTLWTKHIGYGYFRDEFYYLACGRHLAWGYVDHGPIVALQARLGELLFGDSVFAIRILSAAPGAASVFLTGVISWVLGGRRPAQALAMFGLILCPQYIGTDGYLSMNSFEPVFWMTCALALLLLLRGHSQRLWWSTFGISAGVGLLNKPSMAFFLVAVALGLLLTPERRVLFSRWAAMGIVLLLAIPLPNLLWQIHNHWPTYEFLHNGAVKHKNTALGPISFFLAQFTRHGPGQRSALGPWSCRAAPCQVHSQHPLARPRLPHLPILDVCLHAKDYYLAAIYPGLFAAGAIAWEHRFAASPAVQRNRITAFPIFESVLLVTGLIILPMSSPVLAPATWVRYTTALHLQAASKTETAANGPLPQFYADRFGWDQEVGIVVQTFSSLTPSDQRRVCIFASNYGEAGAIDFLGPPLDQNLPPAISGHNNYWLWGMHGCDANLVIAVVSDTPQQLAKKYQSIAIVGRMDNPYAMPFEHRNIYLLRDRRPSAPLDWADERFYF